jgi:hypothetical protein
MFRQQHPDARMLERLVSCALRTPVPNIPVPQYPRIPASPKRKLLNYSSLTPILPILPILLELFPY